MWSIFEKVPWGAEKKQKDGSCFHIHSVSLCLFISELSPLILREINVQGWNLPSSAFCKAGFVDSVLIIMWPLSIFETIFKLKAVLRCYLEIVLQNLLTYLCHRTQPSHYSILQAKLVPSVMELNTSALGGEKAKEKFRRRRSSRP
ncbi:hypothetical protein STEG23_024198, partial [Scotinomys teguina]